MFMPRSKTARFVPCVVLFSLMLSMAALAREASADERLKAELTAMLDAGLKPGIKSLSDARGRYSNLIERAATAGESVDVRAHYAMSVVAIKHHRYDLATEAIDAMLAQKPKLWVTQQARMWLLVVQKQYEPALEQMRRTSRQWADESLTDERLAQRARHLGRLFGFIVSDEQRVNGKLAASYEQSIREHLGTAGAQAFGEGRTALIEAYTSLHDEKQRAQVEDKAADVQRRADEKVELAAERGQTEQDAAALEELGVSLQNELNETLRQIDSDVGSLRADLAELERLAAPIRDRIRRLQGEYFVVQGQFNAIDPEDVIGRSRVATLLRSIDIEIAREQARYRPIAAEGQQVEGSIARLLGQRQAAVGRFEKQAIAIRKQLNTAARRIKRIDADNEKLEQTDATGRSRRVLAQEAVLDAFTTYEPFPVEQEKQKILDSLR